MHKINQKYINKLVLKALEEDLRPNGDITTKLLNSKNKIVQAKIISKQSGCLLYTSPSPRDLYRSRMPSSA